MQSVSWSVDQSIIQLANNKQCFYCCCLVHCYLFSNMLLQILHLSEGQFKHLLEEQIQNKRSEEFDDIGHVLGQQGEETKRETSWRILERTFKVEKKKKKRGTDVKKSGGKNKKFKKDHNDERLGTEDCNLEVILERNPQSKACNNLVKPPCFSECLETGSAASQQKKCELTASAGRAGNCLSTVVGGNLKRTKTKDAAKNVKQGSLEGGDVTCDTKRAENDEMSETDSSDCGSHDEYDIDVDEEISGGGDDDDDDDDDDDNADDDDDGDDEDDDGEEEEEEEEEKDELEQILTYGKKQK